MLNAKINYYHPELILGFSLVLLSLEFDLLKIRLYILYNWRLLQASRDDYLICFFFQ